MLTPPTVRARRHDPEFQMKTNSDERSGVPLLVPTTEGWHFIAARKTMEKEEVFRKSRLSGRTVVRGNENGAVRVTEAICPHPGSDPVPEADTVRGCSRDLG